MIRRSLKPKLACFDGLKKPRSTCSLEAADKQNKRGGWAVAMCGDSWGGWSCAAMADGAAILRPATTVSAAACKNPPQPTPSTPPSLAGLFRCCNGRLGECIQKRENRGWITDILSNQVVVASQLHLLLAQASDFEHLCQDNEDTGVVQAKVDRPRQQMSQGSSWPGTT